LRPAYSPAAAVGWVVGQVSRRWSGPTCWSASRWVASPPPPPTGLAAVWLTPLLHRPEVVEALARASAPFLLVGGTADPSWDGAVARRLTPHVLEVPDAHHGMLVPGPLARSAEVRAGLHRRRGLRQMSCPA
jgi:hypothetical protein